MTESTEPFDVEHAVSEYRRIIAQLDAETSDVGRDEYRRIAQRMRNAWKEWQGEDSLGEMAFGEPLEWETNDGTAAK